MTISIATPEWMDEAACLDHDPDMFYDQGTERIIPPSVTTLNAIEICKTCPVVAQCLALAMQNGERWGVWGGTTYVERAAIREKTTRKRGRPLSPIRHGTAAGYAAHRRRGIPACRSCIDAETQRTYERAATRANQSQAKDTA